MILYHGSTMEVSQPHILKSEIGRDFGFAFYTTDIQAQAERWARRRAISLVISVRNFSRGGLNYQLAN